MFYDLGVVPLPNSLLETLMAVFAQKKQFTSYLNTRLLVEAILAPHAEGKIKLEDTFDRYMNSALPYLGKTSVKLDQKDKEVLDRWTSRQGLKVKPHLMKKNVPGKIKSALKESQQRVQRLEELRRSGRIKKIK